MDGWNLAYHFNFNDDSCQNLLGRYLDKGLECVIVRQTLQSRNKGNDQEPYDRIPHSAINTKRERDTYN